MYARMHVNVEPVSITIGEVIHVLNIMKCMDSDIMYIINVYNDIWNATYTIQSTVHSCTIIMHITVGMQTCNYRNTYKILSHGSSSH